MHFDAPLAVALASLAPTTLHVEAESPGLIPALAGFRQHGIELANRGKHAGVRGGVRTRRPPDGRLIDLHNLVNVLDAEDLAMCAGFLHRTVEFGGKRAVENIIYKRGFPRAGNTGDHGEQPEGNYGVNVL